MMTAKYPCDFTGSAWELCRNFAISARGRTIIPIAYDHRTMFFVPMISARSACGLRGCPYGDRAVLLRCVTGLRAFDFLIFCIMQSYA